MVWVLGLGLGLGAVEVFIKFSKHQLVQGLVVERPQVVLLGEDQSVLL